MSLYHYCALTQIAGGNLKYFDGVITCDRIETPEQYEIVRERLAKDSNTPVEKLSILALELL